MELVAAVTERDQPDATGAREAATQRGPQPWGHIMGEVFVCLALAALAYGCFQLSQHYVFRSIRVCGRSMLPTLPDSEWYLLNRIVYLFREPQAEDIVVLRDPEDKGYSVKRIIAKPGDSICVREGQVFVNGKLLQEKYLPPGTKTFSHPKYPAQFWVCGTNRYFVLGDNRNNSADSRLYGAVSREDILGVISP